jgi:tetratricopeptide (TPR) repeat protein
MPASRTELLVQRSIPSLLINKKKYIAEGDAQLQLAADILENRGNVGIKKLKWRLTFALEAYVRAAEAYHIAARWNESSECYGKAASIYLEQSRRDPKLKDFAAFMFANASYAVMKLRAGGGGKAAMFCQRAVKIYSSLGRYDTCANLEHKLADWSLEQCGQHEKAAQHYCNAASYYEKNHSSMPTANVCTVKAARILGSNEEFENASMLFGQVAKKEIYENLSKSNANEYMLYSLLLLLASKCRAHGDQPDQLLGASPEILDAARDFHSMDGQFALSVECLFVENLVQSCKQLDIHHFANHVYYFHEVFDLDCWTRDVLKVVCDWIQHNQPEEYEHF